MQVIQMTKFCLMLYALWLFTKLWVLLKLAKKNSSKRSWTDYKKPLIWQMPPCLRWTYQLPWKSLKETKFLNLWRKNPKLSLMQASILKYYLQQDSGSFTEFLSRCIQFYKRSSWEFWVAHVRRSKLSSLWISTYLIIYLLILILFPCFLPIKSDLFQRLRFVTLSRDTYFVNLADHPI